MTYCIIVEDQGPAQEILQTYIQQTDRLELIGTFNDVLEASDFMQNHPVDLLFLDINLPKMSGMDYLRREEFTPKTILTTAYSEFALEGYEYNVVDYLLKPFSYERFRKAMRKVMPQTRNQEAMDAGMGAGRHSTLYVKAGTGLVKVDTQEIVFIKSDGDYTEVITTEGKHLVSHSLKEWTEKLSDDFVQVHRSYIIHVKYIRKVAGNKVYLDGEMVPIGRAYKNTFMEALSGDK